jgi:hypothetical protein
MTLDTNILAQIDALHDMGRDFVERSQIHGVAVEFVFDVCRFDQWRRRVNDLLFTLGGCDDLYYQRFSKEVTVPHVRDLEKGLRILNAVRDDVSREIAKETTGRACPETGCTGLSVSFH